MLAFAGNSLLCRIALGTDVIDAVSFTTIRFVSAAIVVLAAAALAGRPAARESSWRAALVLFVYAFPFAFAYTRLDTGTGALILFGTVQLTMVGAAWLGGERPSRFEWTGLVLAAAGLCWLASPGRAASPSFAGALLMAVAGIAWAVYSLLGRRRAEPLAAVAGTFARLAPLTLAVSALAWRGAHVSMRGIALAALSGAVTSGGGYVVWYAVLPRLDATRAAILQLSVPALAAFAGVLVLGERVTTRLVAGAALILGGIALSIAGHAAAAVAGARERSNEAQ